MNEIRRAVIASIEGLLEVPEDFKRHEYDWAIDDEHRVLLSHRMEKYDSAASTVGRSIGLYVNDDVLSVNVHRLINPHRSGTRPDGTSFHLESYSSSISESTTVFSLSDPGLIPKAAELVQSSFAWQYCGPGNGDGGDGRGYGSASHYLSYGAEYGLEY